MKSKEYIIEKLVSFGKKHRALKYPMLALVSVISLFYLVLEKCLEKPKRAVIALVCLVLILTQSWYLISLAADTDPASAGNTSGDATIQTSGDPQDPEDPGDPVVPDMTPVGDEAQTVYAVTYYDPSHRAQISTGDIVHVDQVSASDLATYSLYDTTAVTDADLYALTGWSLTNGGTTVISGVADIQGALESNGSVDLYAVWERTHYRVSYDANGGTLADSSATTTQLLPINSTSFTTLGSNIYTKTGYHYTEWMINDSTSNLVPTQNSWTITDQDLVLKPNWVQNTYTITYDKNDISATGTMEDRTVSYDETVTLDPCAFAKQGYSFAGWTDDNGTVYRDSSSVSNLTETDGGTFTLHAQWSYQNAVPSATSGSYEYSDSFSLPIHVQHSASDDGNFTLSVNSVSGTTLDGAITSAETLESIAGVSVAIDGNDIVISSAGVKTVGQTVIHFQAIDNNNQDSNNQARLSYFDVTLDFTKKGLTVTGVENSVKTYDGLSTIGVQEIQYTDGNGMIDGLQIFSDGQKGYFDDANVGEGKTLTLTGLILSGAKASYYTVSTDSNGAVEVPGGGTIERRNVAVTTAPVYTDGTDFILTGQNPTFTVTVNESNLPTATASEDKQLILDTITGGSNPSANLYDCAYGTNNFLAGTYSIGIKETDAETAIVNYDLSISSGTLTVKTESAEPGVNYTIEGHTGHPVNGWYGIDEPTVTPLGSYYDKVYVTTNSAQYIPTYDNGASFADYVEITEDMSRASHIYLQLASSTTGAVTAITEFDNVKVDVTAPTVDTGSIEYSTTNGDNWSKIGRFLSFGNFFKEKIKISIPVNDLYADGTTPDHSSQVSGAESLTYYLNDATTGTEVTINNGVAAFTVDKDFEGTIKLVATDAAENQTEQATLLGMEGGQLWVIEDQPPVVSLNATNGLGRTVYSNATTYHNEVILTAEVTDEDSGISYAEWTITKDGVASTVTTDALTSMVEHKFFEQTFDETGTYSVVFKAYDNATNVNEETAAFEFIIDSTPPTVTLDPTDPDDSWATEKTVKFTMSDSESGYDYFILRDGDDNVYPSAAVDTSTNTYSFTTSTKGTYTIYAYDKAGNETVVPVELAHVSAEVPDDPQLQVDGTDYPNINDDTDVEDVWYTSDPSITIVEASQTPDHTGIDCYYHMWEAGSTEPSYPNQHYDGAFNLPSEGIWNIRIWAETESGVINPNAESDNSIYQIRYDGTAPTFDGITITKVGDTNKLLIEIGEDGSGLKSLAARYTQNGTERTKSIAFTNSGSGTYSATVNIGKIGAYKLVATDYADNEAETASIEPMSITINKIYVNGTTVDVEGYVTAGTYDISNVTVAYGTKEDGAVKAADNLVTTKNDATGDIAFTAEFANLSYETTYVFEAVARETNGEYCSTTGAFRTAAKDATGRNLAGTVVDEGMASGDTTEIPIFLYQNGTVLQTTSAGNGETFIFTNVPDGTYTVKASNDDRTDNCSVVIYNGEVVEPSGLIQLVLRVGKSTDVEIDSGADSGYVVSGLDNFFDDTTNFNESDVDKINDGDTIQFCMTIREVGEGDVDSADLALIKGNLHKKESVLKYMDFSVWKRVFDAYGLREETQVSALNGGKSVRVVIPLPDSVVGKTGLAVIRVHNGSASRLSDVDTNPNTYTVDSSLYSTYALVYYDDTAVTTTENDASTATTENPDNGGSGSTSDSNSTTSTTDISKKPSVNGSPSGKYSPATGDATPVCAVGGIFLLAMGGCIFLLLRQRKERN